MRRASCSRKCRTRPKPSRSAHHSECQHGGWSMPSCEWCGPGGLVGWMRVTVLRGTDVPAVCKGGHFVVRRALLRIPPSNLLPYQILQGIFAFRGLAELPNGNAATPHRRYQPRGPWSAWSGFVTSQSHPGPGSAKVKVNVSTHTKRWGKGGRPPTSRLPRRKRCALLHQQGDGVPASARPRALC